MGERTDAFGELARWPEALERAVARTSAFNRALVVAETGSTQDAAAGATPGMVLVAGRQTNGRGRLGRVWRDHAGRSLACSMTLPGTMQAGALALRVGVGVALACERACSRPLGIRWPNDVVDPASGRKLAGVLIESRNGRRVVGVGINVGHAAEDWDEELRPVACSLRELGSGLGRLDVARLLIAAMDEALSTKDADAAEHWAARDTLRGSTRRFRHNGHVVVGEVESIEPTGAIVVRTDAGDRERLPAITTSLVHD